VVSLIAAAQMDGDATQAERDGSEHTLGRRKSRRSSIERIALRRRVLDLRRQGAGESGSQEVARGSSVETLTG
jgi:hypothetical protein